MNRKQHAWHFDVDTKRGLAHDDGEIVQAGDRLAHDLEIFLILELHCAEIGGVMAAAFTASDPYVAVRFELTGVGAGAPCPPPCCANSSESLAAQIIINAYIPPASVASQFSRRALYGMRIHLMNLTRP